jgi:hypothetical protein
MTSGQRESRRSYIDSLSLDERTRELLYERIGGGADGGTGSGGKGKKAKTAADQAAEDAIRAIKQRMKELAAQKKAMPSLSEFLSANTPAVMNVPPAAKKVSGLGARELVKLAAEHAALLGVKSAPVSEDYNPILWKVKPKKT